MTIIGIYGNGGGCFGHRIIAPDKLIHYDFDYIVIAMSEHAEGGKENICQIRNQLDSYGIPMDRILLMSKDIENDMKIEYPRVEFLRNLANDFIEHKISGDVAECGVCFGDFASKINTFFPDKECYLFDTFSSFDDRDIIHETDFSKKAIYGARLTLARANPELVYLKMPHKNNVFIREGYVPDTFVGLESKMFCFVNLDMDLYAPTIASLKWFSDKMVRDGVMLVHDYYSSQLDGVKRAVDEFTNDYNCIKLPIGDSCSIALKMT